MNEVSLNHSSLNHIYHQDEASDDPGITIYMFATNNNVGFHNARTSLEKFNYSYRVLAFGKKWKGWRQRMTAYYEAAKQHSTEYGEHSIIMFMDAYDVVALRSSAEMKSVFESFDKPIVCCTESGCVVNCVPLKTWYADHADVDMDGVDNRYVNAGLIVGRCGHLATLYRWILDHGYTDDQIGMGNYINAHTDIVALDHPRKLLYTCSGTFEGVPDTITRGESAFFAHFPGMERCQVYRSWQYNKITRQLSPYCLPLHTFADIHRWIVLGLIIAVVVLFLLCIYLYRTRTPR